MEARAGIAIALLLMGCTQSQISEGNSEPIVAASPTVAPRLAPQQRNIPRRLKFQLTLDQPEDLKVKVGDSVVKGQVISDHKSTRTDLAKEREVLRQQLNQLQIQTTTPSHSVEQAEVEQARLRVEQARVAIANFHADSPWTDYARRVLTLPDHSQLRALEIKYQEARGKLAISTAKLKQAQRQQGMNQGLSAQRAELTQRIHELEVRLKGLGVVRSPYDGQIKSIKWLGQINQELQVELVINVASVPSR